MVAAVAEVDTEGRGVDIFMVGDAVCCCFISTTTFMLKLGESICWAASRRLSNGLFILNNRCFRPIIIWSGSDEGGASANVVMKRYQKIHFYDIVRYTQNTKVPLFSEELETARLLIKLLCNGW